MKISNSSHENFLSLGTFENALEQLKKNPYSSFISAPCNEKLWKSSEGYADLLRQNFEQLAVIGVGGSSLGAQSYCRALGIKSTQLLFLDTLDPVSLEEKISTIASLEKTHFLIISKSGKTLETLHIADYIYEVCQKTQLKNINQHFSVICDKGQSPLADWAEKNTIPTLDFPPSTSGRFSIFTPAGLIPIGFATSLTQLRKGMNNALKEQEQLYKIVNAAWTSYQKKDYVHNLWIYCDRLSHFGLWLNQLWSESLGKSDTEHPFPILKVCRGSNDQHSYLQQTLDGKHAQFQWIINLESNKRDPVSKKRYINHDWNTKSLSFSEIYNFQSQSIIKTFEQEGLKYLNINLGEISEETLGSLYLQMMLMIATLGELMSINAFNQPGVEKQKINFSKLLENTN